MYRDPDSSLHQEVRIIALTGFMGAGKTSVGHELAELLGWSFVDLDHAIEVEQKLRIGEIFQRYGEPRFREIECEILGRILDQAEKPTVIALGGGTFIHPPNVELLRSRKARVIFLEAPVEVLLKRCRVGEPCLVDNPRPLAADPDAFRALYQQRLPAYRTAHVTMPAEGRSTEQLAREIVACLRLEANAR